MKIGLIRLLAVALAVAGMVCGQALAGGMPSQSAVSKTASQPIKPAGGLTAEQSLALAVVEPGVEEGYGDMDQTTQVIVVATVCVIAILVVASAVEWHHWH